MKVEFMYHKTRKHRLCNNPVCGTPIPVGTEYGTATMIGGPYPPTRYYFCLLCAEMIESAVDEDGHTPFDTFEDLLNEAYGAAEYDQEDGGLF